jgi:hypothetical protein
MDELYLDTTTASETSDGGLGDTLDVVSQDLAMSLGSTLAEALATFAASSHVDEGVLLLKEAEKLDERWRDERDVLKKLRWC